MRTDRLVTLISALLDGARTDRKTVFLRTLLFGIAGAIAGGIAMEVAPLVVGGPSISAYWFWMCAAGFAGAAFANLVNEYFGLYTNGPFSDVDHTIVVPHHLGSLGNRLLWRWVLGLWILVLMDDDCVATAGLGPSRVKDHRAR